MSDLEKNINEAAPYSVDSFDEKDVEVGEQIITSDAYESGVESESKEGSSSEKLGLGARMNMLATKYKMEVIGIEQVPEDKRTDKSPWTPGFLWFSVNLVLPPVSIGTLSSSVFYLSFWDAVLASIFFNFLGCIPVAFYATLGPEFGLRQMAMSRFWFGYHGVKIFSILNVIGSVCWTALNTIVAASLLHAINDGQLPEWAGILIVAVLVLIISCFGYKVLHFFEQWTWLPTMIMLWILIARLQMSHTFAPGKLAVGQAEAGNVLSYGATLFGGANGWATYAADYSVYQRKDASKWKIFIAVFFGVSIPLIFCSIIGNAIICAADNSTRLGDAYDDNGFGGLIYAIMVTDALHGFGKFCTVVLALSCVGVSVVNIYSLAFCMQTVSHYFAYVPRFLWSAIGTGVYFGISMGAYYNFSQYIENFMDIIAYWICIYEGISLPEHFIFKKGNLKSYRVEDITHPERLPPGYATAFAFACGVGGVVLGMDQVWWAGPAATAIPGDIGWEFALAFSFVGYMVARPIERHYFRR
ncbi:permease for cytosine/purines, uracil, thiamine, allantoin-domain-containing protein [Lipomyces oligophaga]|uniref:permease for cytosine/purines, uracil, thiamine, allantoin-domain-containing protein n=1 Tax=Lipomyces oligophaga TaxID=45792 RepID=UPI0034CFA2C8